MKRMLGLIIIIFGFLGIAYFQSGTTTQRTQTKPTVGILQLTT
ncbi:MAG TPA: peptide ABC transporter substrate-binding protein, partial [Lactobacillus sp.]|nr:peptide ABC transporter substrate-binding protein [Lactobacillus sp.]